MNIERSKNEKGEITTPIDYAELLRKYIRHVRDCEGIDYILDGSTLPNAAEVSDAEWAALKRLAKR